MIVSALVATNQFKVTENREHADAILIGSSYRENFSGIALVSRRHGRRQPKRGCSYQGFVRQY